MQVVAADAETRRQGALQVPGRWHIMVGVIQHKVANALRIWAQRQESGHEAAVTTRNRGAGSMERAWAC